MMRSFFGVMPVLFGVFIILFFVFFGVTLIRGIKTWNKNNHSPRLTVEATVVAKRQNTDVHHYHNAGDVTGAQGMHTSTTTDYYVTFQVASGDRMELHMGGHDYALLAEGDFGDLSFQGTRYLGFQRHGSKTYDSSGGGDRRERASWDPER